LRGWVVVGPQLRCWCPVCGGCCLLCGSGSGERGPGWCELSWSDRSVAVAVACIVGYAVVRSVDCVGFCRWCDCEPAQLLPGRGEHRTGYEQGPADCSHVRCLTVELRKCPQRLEKGSL